MVVVRYCLCGIPMFCLFRGFLPRAWMMNRSRIYARLRPRAKWIVSAPGRSILPILLSRLSPESATPTPPSVQLVLPTDLVLWPCFVLPAYRAWAGRLTPPSKVLCFRLTPIGKRPLESPFDTTKKTKRANGVPSWLSLDLSRPLPPDRKGDQR